MYKKLTYSTAQSSIVNPSPFHMDPDSDPQIRASDQWIRCLRSMDPDPDPNPATIFFIDLQDANK
jgi:hypothetical protein